MGWYDLDEKIKAMFGRKLESVTLDSDKDTVAFRFQDGHTQAFGVEGLAYLWYCQRWRPFDDEEDRVEPDGP